MFNRIPCYGIRFGFRQSPSSLPARIKKGSGYENAHRPIILLELNNSVAKSGILSRDLGIFLSSWDFFVIFILKSESRDFWGIFEKV